MTNRDTVFKIVYRINGQKKTAVVTARDKDSAARRVKRGARIVSISKMDQAGLFNLGDVSKMLMPDPDSTTAKDNIFTKKFFIDNKNDRKEKWCL